MKKSIIGAVCVCVGLLSLFLSASFVLSGSQSTLLSKPPEHGTAFIISFESKGLAGDTNALAKLEAAVTERFSKLGAKFYWEPISPTRVRVITPVQDPRDAELFRQTISRGTTMEFRLVHEDNERMQAEGASDDAYEWLESTNTSPKGVTNIQKVLVQKKPLLTGTSIQHASMGRDPSGQPMILFSLNDEGAGIFASITTTNIGRRLGIVIDGQLMSSPSIRTPITGGKGQISGSFTEQSARELANSLDCPLPFPITMTVEKTF